jgi:hypothetical protein
MRSSRGSQPVETFDNEILSEAFVPVLTESCTVATRPRVVVTPQGNFIVFCCIIEP